MMQLYDPALEIFKNVGNLLAADNSATLGNVGNISIHNYVGNKIFQGDTLVNGDTLPRIIMSFNSGPGQGNLPFEKGELHVKVFYEKGSATNYKTLCKWCSNRVIRLLHNKPGTISSSAIAVRTSDLLSCFYLDDPDGVTYYASITFNLTYAVSIK